MQEHPIWYERQESLGLFGYYEGLGQKADVWFQCYVRTSYCQKTLLRFPSEYPVVIKIYRGIINVFRDASNICDLTSLALLSKCETL